MDFEEDIDPADELKTAFNFVSQEDGQQPLDPTLFSSSHADLADVLLEEFSELPKKAKKMDLDDYAVVNVAPSIVPNPYLPSFRVYAYNVTGSRFLASSRSFLDEQRNAYSQGEYSEEQRKKKKGRKKKHDKDKPDVDCSRKENRSRWACRPKKPQHADPESPSRSNRLWTPLGYAQVRRVQSITGATLMILH